MAQYQADLSQQATSKTKETNRLLGRRAVWDESDQQCQEKFDRDTKDTEFMVSILERHGYNLREESNWFVPTIGSQAGMEPEHKAAYKEHGILPLTARKRKRADARTDTKFFQLCGSRKIGTILVAQGDEANTQHEYQVPGTFGSMAVHPHYCMLSSGGVCSVFELRERFRDLKRMVLAINKMPGVSVQRWTIEVTVREFSWGVTYHPHVNVLYTISKGKIPTFKRYVTAHITQGKYWHDAGKITSKDAGRIAHYINKVPTVKADDECGDGGIDSNGEKGKIITLVELAERHEEEFVEFYRQQYRVKLSGYESHYKIFKEFLDKWGYDVKNIKTEVSGWDKRFNKKSNRITINDRQAREQEKLEKAEKNKKIKKARKEADKAKIAEVVSERDRVLKAVNDYSRKDVQEARRTQQRHNKLIERSGSTPKVQAYKKSITKALYDAEKRQSHEVRDTKRDEVNDRYTTRIEETKQQIKAQRQREIEEERQRKLEEREKNKKGIGENVVITRLPPRKCKKLGCYESYIMVKNYQPDTEEMTKASRENWEKLQDLIEDGCIIAEGNGFNFDTMEATEMVYEDSYHLVNSAWYSLFDIEQPDYTRADFLEDIGLWHDRHFDDHDWKAVIAPTFDNMEVSIILDAIEARWGKNMMTAASVLFLYRDLTFSLQISATPAGNSRFSESVNTGFLQTELEVPAPLPPDIIVGSLEDTFDWPPDDGTPPRKVGIYPTREIDIPF